MKTKLRRDARLLWLFTVLALLPFAIWACSDAGDAPSAPTGPSTKYNPDIDYPGATITANASPSTVAPGETFGVLATYRDANGIPVEGVPLIIAAENGGAIGHFGYQTNPTLTDANGTASIHVTVSAGCPEDSYTFVLGTRSSQSARGYVHVKVGGTSSSPLVTGLSVVPQALSVVEGTQAVFLATADATTSCTVRFMYQAAGAGLTIPLRDAPPGSTNPWLFELPAPYAPGTLIPGTLVVQVRAYCDETSLGLASDPVSVTVTAAP